MADISFTVNGRTATADIDSADTLLHVLRNHVDLKGTRYGCGIEECGACMVLVNGKPTFSCTFAAQDIDGQSITTVEGLARNDGDGSALHPVQQAFLDEQAGQCGYCLSGIMVSATALLDANPDPSREQIVAALEPHLCRCGAQTRMLRAVERAAQILRNEVAS